MRKKRFWAWLKHKTGILCGFEPKNNLEGATTFKNSVFHPCIKQKN